MRSIRRLSKCAASACLCFMLADQIPSPAATLKAIGYVVQEQFDQRDGSLKQTDRFDFEVSVLGRAYKIHTQKLTNLLPGEIAEIVTGSDGTDSFSVNVTHDTNAVLWVESSAYPKGALVSEIGLWLAYCSSEYLVASSDNRSLIRDGYLLSEYAPSDVRVVVTPSTSPPHLLMGLDVLSPSYLPSPAGQKKVPLPVPYQRGYRLCRFNVARHVLVDGLAISSEFTIESYITRLSGAATADDLSLKGKLRVCATNVSATVVEDDIRVTLTKPYTAYDFRFLKQTRGKAFSYMVTNTPLRSRDDPVVLQALTRKLSERTDEGVRPKGKKFLLLLFAVFGVMPLCIAIRKQWKQKVLKHTKGD